MDTIRLAKSALKAAKVLRIMNCLSFEDLFRVLALIDASLHFGKIALLVIFPDSVQDSPQIPEQAEITLSAQHPFSSR